MKTNNRGKEQHHPDAHHGGRCRCIGCGRPAAPWLMGTTKLPDVGDYKWELYDLTEDFSENNNVAAENPDKLRELQAVFMTEAAKYNVFPLDNAVLPRLLTPRP